MKKKEGKAMSTLRNSRRAPTSVGVRWIHQIQIEPLESRTLLSESASAQVTLVSTTGAQPTAVYDYQITLTNTGTTNIGTFWFAWTPPGDPTEYDFLPSLPTPTGEPAGWTGPASPGFPGNSIEYYNVSGSPIVPGQTGTFSFTSPDSPTILQGTSLGFPITTSFIYAGMPEVGSFAQVSPVTLSVPPSSVTLLANGDLIVDGTAGDDTIALTVTGSSLTAAVNGLASQSFPVASITSIDVEANTGNDLITLDAGVPAASVQGGPGADTITASNAGNNTLGGGKGRDSITGGSGDDLIHGGQGADSITAGTGNDSLFGGLGPDTLQGGPGNDYLNGGAGTNHMIGGAGNTTTFYAANGTNDEIFAGSATNDTLFFSTDDNPIIETGSIPSGNTILVS